MQLQSKSMTILRGIVLFLISLLILNVTYAKPTTTGQIRFFVNGQELDAQNIITSLHPIHIANEKMPTLISRGQPISLKNGSFSIEEGATGSKIYECALDQRFSQETSMFKTQEILIRFGHQHRAGVEERLELRVEFTKTEKKLEQILVQQIETGSKSQTKTQTFVLYPEKLVQEQMTFSIYPKVLIINKYRSFQKIYYPSSDGSWPIVTELPSQFSKPTQAVELSRIHPDDPVYLTLVQGSTEIEITDQQAVGLERKPFSFRFPLREYNSKAKEYFAACFACSKTDRIFQFQAGLDTWNASVFSPGKSMAAGPGGFETMVLRDNAFHYIMYDSDNIEDQRASLVRRIKDDLNEVEWVIPAIDNISVEKCNISRIYVAYYYDKNLDLIIDEGEYRRFTLDFVK